MKKIVLLTLGLLACSFLQAQDNSKEITSTVTDENNVPLIGVTITAFTDSKYLAGTVSNLEGKFSILADAHSYVFSYIGYEPETYSAEELKNEKSIVLETAIHELQSVFVYAQSKRTGCRYICKYVVEPRDQNKNRIKRSNPFKKPTISSWSVYPNPASEWVNINSKKTEGSINIIAANGQVVTSKMINSYTTEINLNHLPNGAYYLQYVKNGEIEHIGSLIKADPK